MYQEMRCKDDAWMQSIHESIDQLSEILDSMPKDGTTLQNDDEYLCDKEVAYTFADEQRKGENDGIGKLIYRRLMIDQFQILPCNNEKCTVLLLVHKKVVPLFQDELYINANYASM